MLSKHGEKKRQHEKKNHTLQCEEMTGSCTKTRQKLHVTVLLQVSAAKFAVWGMGGGWSDTTDGCFMFQKKHLPNSKCGFAVARSLPR